MSTRQPDEGEREQDAASRGFDSAEQLEAARRKIRAERLRRAADEAAEEWSESRSRPARRTNPHD